jgi:hypothetical protein
MRGRSAHFPQTGVLPSRERESPRLVDAHFAGGRQRVSRGLAVDLGKPMVPIGASSRRFLVIRTQEPPLFETVRTKVLKWGLAFDLRLALWQPLVAKVLLGGQSALLKVVALAFDLRLALWQPLVAKVLLGGQSALLKVVAPTARARDRGATPRRAPASREERNWRLETVDTGLMAVGEPRVGAVDLRSLGTRRLQRDRVGASRDRVRDRGRTRTRQLGGAGRDGGGVAQHRQRL